MANRELTEFQLKCERNLVDRLRAVGKTISARTLGGKTETYIAGSIKGTNISFWIYDDGADFKSSSGSLSFEKPDYKSLDDLAEGFVESIIKSIENPQNQVFDSSAG